MIIFESIKEAFKSIRTNAVRSFLTMLGIIIGIASVTMLVGIGEGFKDAFTAEVDSIGANMVVVMPGDIDAITDSDGEGGGFSALSQGIGASTLSEKDIEDLMNVEGFKNVTAMSIAGGVVKAGDVIGRNTIPTGTNENIFTLFESYVLHGDVFTADDNENHERVVVLSEMSAEELFGVVDSTVIGEQISIFDTEFTVVGITGDDPNKEDVSSSISIGTEFDAMIYVPINTLWEVTEQKNIIRIMGQAENSEVIDDVVTRAKAVMAANHTDKDYSVVTQEDLVAVFESVFGMLSSAILGITAISLIVGGIGIMNIMLVSVTERTREIGLRKAVGATGTTILVQFMTEAIVLSLLGGAFGYALSFVGGIAASNALGFDIPVTMESIILAFSVSITVGVVFGVAPAIRAARKHPIDALRYE